MNELVETLNFYMATGGILMAAVALILVFDLKTKRALASIVSTWGMLGAFFITLGSSAMTLIYSDVFGFIPCGLCWFQRIFLYPQVVILAIGIYYRDKTVLRSGIALSVLGTVVALYQHYLQMGGSEVVGCPTAGQGADCSQRILFEYGFVTFPLLSAIAFIFLIALYAYLLRSERSAS